jgi:hypothetical protein
MHALITLAWLAAALAFYTLGSTTGLIVFLFVGVVAESIFWFRLLRRKGSAARNSDP